MYWKFARESSVLSWVGLKNVCYSNYLEEASWSTLKILLVYGSLGAAKRTVELGKLNGGLIEVAKGGHKDLVKFFISKGANGWVWGMAGAAEGGHNDLVEFFKTKL